MKLSKVNILILSGILLASSFGLLTFADNISFKDLKNDIKNSIQHIGSVYFINENNNDVSTADHISAGSNQNVSISSNNFILTPTSDKNIITSSEKSSILGGIKNKIISSKFGVILAGKENTLQNNSENSSILGGIHNTVNGNNSNIIGGYRNTINKNNSSILGSQNTIRGDNSMIIGISNDLKGNESIILGANGKLEADRSFFWTDGEQTSVLNTDDVASILSKNGMVVNTNKAHPSAQLTIGGSLTVNHNENDKNVSCGQGKGKGILKIISKSDSNQVCFCNCNGSERESIFGNGQCEGECKGGKLQPVCGETVQKYSYGNNKYAYVGTCKEGKGKPIQGSGSHYISEGKIYRRCQTNDGTTEPCTGSIANAEPVTCNKNLNVYYDKNGGNSVSREKASIHYGDSVDLTVTATPKNSQYTFKGWNTDPNATNTINSYTMQCENIRLYAIYSKNTYYMCDLTEPSGEGVTTGSSSYPEGYTPTSWEYITGSNVSACQWTCLSGFVQSGNTCTPEGGDNTGGGDTPNGGDTPGGQDNPNGGNDSNGGDNQNGEDNNESCFFPTMVIDSIEKCIITYHFIQFNPFSSDYNRDDGSELWFSYNNLDWQPYTTNKLQSPFTVSSLNGKSGPLYLKFKYSSCKGFSPVYSYDMSLQSCPKTTTITTEPIKIDWKGERFDWQTHTVYNDYGNGIESATIGRWENCLNHTDDSDWDGSSLNVGDCIHSATKISGGYIPCGDNQRCYFENDSTGKITSHRRLNVHKRKNVEN